MADTPERPLGARIPLWTAVMGLLGGFLGGGAEGLLKWWEFREHLSEFQQQQILEVVKLATDLDQKKVASAVDYIDIIAADLPPRVKERLLSIAGHGARPEVLVRINDRFPETVGKSGDLKALILPGHPRVFIQFAREEQRPWAEKIQAALTAGKIDAPGIELIPRYTGGPELRYFYAEEAGIAARIATDLAAIVPGLTCRRVAGFAGKPGVKPQLFELWIGPNAQPASGGLTPSGPAICTG